MSGFTTNGVVERIQKIEEAAWLNYTALCTMLQLRNMPKKIAETKIFGTEKPTATFKWAWDMAKIVKGSVYTDATLTDIGNMQLGDAMDTMVTTMRGHMVSLGVKGKNAYREVAHFASGEALKVAVEKQLADAAADAAREAEEKAAQEASASGASDAVIEATQAETAAAAAAIDPERDIVAEADALAALMTEDQLNKLAILITERLTAMVTELAIAA